MSTTVHTPYNASGIDFDNLPHGKDQRYYDLLAFIVSNGIAGELMAIDNYTQMVPILTSTEDKLEAVEQAQDESKHVKLLASLGKKLDFGVKTEIVEPEWKIIRAHFDTAVRNNDLASCYITQDLMVETLAVVLYKTLGRNTDPNTRKVADNILRDEMKHLQIGIDRIKAMLDKDADSVHKSLTDSHNAVVPVLFSSISYNCTDLCDDLAIDCSSLGLDSVATDLDTVRVDALDTYMDMLDRVGFDTKVTTPLIAKLQSNLDSERVSVAGDCCSSASA
ncbi:MAG: ferritin-like domain-containing protein [Pseudomonadota bacterium]